MRTGSKETELYMTTYYQLEMSSARLQCKHAISAVVAAEHNLQARGSLTRSRLRSDQTPAHCPCHMSVTTLVLPPGELD